MTEREQIEELHQNYISLKEHTPWDQRDGEECRAYHKWYENAYVYFKSFDYLQNDPDFQTFVNAEKEGNCFVLEHIYDTISPSYKVLMLKTGKVQRINSNESTAKDPMVFISHSSKDRDFAKALVVLLEDLGFDNSNLFCSSIDGYGIGLSEDIFDTLWSLFNEHNLYVIFIHSPRYYNSAISLNEMGAAWVLKTDFCSFLTTDMDFSMMKGVVNGNTISIKVDAEDTPSRLNELKDRLIALFGLGSINETKWENARGRFIKEVNALSYDSPHEEFNEIANKALSTPPVFSEKEYKVLRQWVESNDNLGLVCEFMGGKIYILGDNQYEVGGGREEARWNAFIDKLQDAGFIAYKGNNRQGDPQYELQNSAYEYFGVE